MILISSMVVVIFASSFRKRKEGELLHRLMYKVNYIYLVSSVRRKFQADGLMV